MPPDQTASSHSEQSESATEMIGADRPHAEIIDPSTREIWQSIEPCTREELASLHLEPPLLPVGTGQTGIIQRARYGVVLDAIPCQFCSGELEATILEAFERERPDVIIIEGQGALTRPAVLLAEMVVRAFPELERNLTAGAA